MTDSSTPLEQVSRDIPDTMVGDDEDPKAKALRMMQQVAPRLREVAERLSLIERAMAAMLPEVVRDQPIGVVVNLLADIKEAVEMLHGDGSSVVTNQVKARFQFVREVTLPERMSNDKIKNFSTEDWRIAKSVRVLASITGDKEPAYEWLKEHGHGSLIKPTVNSSSLSALAKELMENGHELPEDHFNVHTKDNVSFTRVKKGRGE